MFQLNVFKLALGIVVAGVASADTLLVPSEYGSIQGGIDAAVNGDIVQVDAGVYYEVINFGGKEITVISTDGAEVTTIDGAVNPDDEPVVKFVTAETELSILDGFKIRNGEAYDGAGIYIFSSSPVIRNCIITGNHASRFGGGLYAESSTITLENITIEGNVSKNAGAGMYLKYAEGSLVTGVIKNNSGNHGGGIYAKDGTGDFALSNVHFQGNSAVNNGGGVYSKSSPMSVSDCTFELNDSNRGGGWFSYLDGDATLTNCVFLDNTAADFGGAADIRGSEVTFSQCTFEANIADSDCDGAGGGGAVDIFNSIVTLENPIVCVNLLCDVIDDFSGDDPIIIGDIVGCSTSLGACCGGTACWEMDYADCLEGGGVFHGEETICAMVTCYGNEAGGCCIGDICIMATDIACDEVAGEFHGAYVDCQDEVVCPTACPADLNGDGSVEVNDIIEVISSWGACP